VFGRLCHKKSNAKMRERIWNFNAKTWMPAIPGLTGEAIQSMTGGGARGWHLNAGWNRSEITVSAAGFSVASNAGRFNLSIIT
jgi:hypothetical protein